MKKDIYKEMQEADFKEEDKLIIKEFLQPMTMPKGAKVENWEEELEFLIVSVLSRQRDYVCSTDEDKTFAFEKLKKGEKELKDFIRQELEAQRKEFIGMLEEEHETGDSAKRNLIDYEKILNKIKEL